MLRAIRGLINLRWPACLGMVVVITLASASAVSEVGPGFSGETRSAVDFAEVNVPHVLDPIDFEQSAPLELFDVTVYKNSNGGKDAEIRSDLPNTPNASGLTLGVRTDASTGSIRRSLIGWDLKNDIPVSGVNVPVGAKVNSAVLRLRRSNIAMNSDVAARCRLITEPWVQATWNSQPAAIDVNQAPVIWTSPAAGGVWVEIDVTSMVQSAISLNFYNGGQLNSGRPTMRIEFLLSLLNESPDIDAGHTYISGEVGDGREPELVIDWQTPRIVPTAAGAVNVPIVQLSEGFVPPVSGEPVRVMQHNIEALPKADQEAAIAQFQAVHDAYADNIGHKPAILFVLELHGVATLEHLNSNLPWPFEYVASTDWDGEGDDFNIATNPVFAASRNYNYGVLSRYPIVVNQVMLEDSVGTLRVSRGVMHVRATIHGADHDFIIFHTVPKFNHPIAVREREDHAAAARSYMMVHGVTDAFVGADWNQAIVEAPEETTWTRWLDLGWINPMAHLPEDPAVPENLTSCTWYGEGINGVTCSSIDIALAPPGSSAVVGAHPIPGTGRVNADSGDIGDHHAIGYWIAGVEAGDVEVIGTAINGAGDVVTVATNRRSWAQAGATVAIGDSTFTLTGMNSGDVSELTGSAVTVETATSFEFALTSGSPVAPGAPNDLVVVPMGTFETFDRISPAFGGQLPGADLNGDGNVNGADLAILLSVWGSHAGSPQSADLNFDNVVNGADLAILLANWTG